MDFPPSMQSELLNCFGQLDSPEQIRIVEFAKALVSSPESVSAIKGTPGKEYLKLIGMIPEDDLAEMEKVIEEDCERIESSEW